MSLVCVVVRMCVVAREKKSKYVQIFLIMYFDMYVRKSTLGTWNLGTLVSSVSYKDCSVV